MKKINLVIFGCRDNTLEFIKTLDKSKYIIKKIVTINYNCAKKNNVSGYKKLNNSTNSKNLLTSRKYNLSDKKIINLDFALRKSKKQKRLFKFIYKLIKFFSVHKSSQLSY